MQKSEISKGYKDALLVQVQMFQLSKEQVEEGWVTEGHPFVSNKVARQFPGRSQPAFGKIVAYLSVETSGDGR